jgi:hypothetical protein
MRVRDTISTILGVLLFLVWIAIGAISIFYFSVVAQRDFLPTIGFTIGIEFVAMFILAFMYEGVMKLIPIPRPIHTPRQRFIPNTEPASALAQGERLIPTDMQLIAVDRRGRHLTRLINPREIRTIRPVIVIFVRDPSLVGRALPLEINLADADDNIYYAAQMQPVLKLGTNRIAPSSEYPITRRTTQGVWQIRLYAGRTPWAQQTFSITQHSLRELDRHIGADMEISGDANRIAAELAQAHTVDSLMS